MLFSPRSRQIWVPFGFIRRLCAALSMPVDFSLQASLPQNALLMRISLSCFIPGTAHLLLCLLCLENLELTSYILSLSLSLGPSAGMVAQRLRDAELKKELSTVWPNLSQKTMNLLVTPHKRKHFTSRKNLDFVTKVQCIKFLHFQQGLRIVD